MTRMTGPDCAVMFNLLNIHTYIPPASTPYLAKRRDGALSLTIGCSTRHWLDPFVRVKSSLWLKIHGPSDRELAKKTAD